VLLQAKRLEVQSYFDAEGHNIETILRQKQLIFGAFFPIELDRLLCELNVKVCVLRSGAPPEWHNDHGDTLVLPKIQFQSVLSLQKYTKSAKERLKTLVMQRQGCEHYDAECKRFLQLLNPGNLAIMDKTATSVVLPSLTVRTTLPEDLPLSARAALASNLVGNVVVKVQSLSPPVSDAIARQREVFALVGHPFASDRKLPDGVAITVGVIDNDFDIQSHCGFQSTANAMCAEDGVGRIADHGTHVAGIIAGHESGNQYLGMDPGVALQPIVFDPHQNSSLAPLADAILTHIRKGVAIFNISEQYFPPTSSQNADVVLSMIKNLQRAVLFVAAAGNDGADKSGACDVRPACFGRGFKNVISVIALDRNATSPGLWRGQNEGSNFGTVFDLGAPGEGILSTIRGNKFGVMSGTSQAAPMVTAAAAILLSQDIKLRPEQIRRRLIATSDLFPSMRNLILGGRLNISRAIDRPDQDVFGLLDGTEVAGDLQGSQPKLRFKKDSGLVGEVRPENVLRMSCDKERLCTVMIVNDSGLIEKWPNTTILSTSIKVLIPSGELHAVALRKVVEFVAAIR